MRSRITTLAVAGSGDAGVAAAGLDAFVARRARRCHVRISRRRRVADLDGAGCSGRPTDPSPLTVVSIGKRVRLVAIDGFDSEAYRAATGPDGRLGQMLVRNGPSLAPQDSSDPARAWTSIATGVPADVHGVVGIETRRVAGVQGTIGGGDSAVGRVVRAASDMLRLTRPSITSREERRAKTFWEVAADAGLRTAVINWWATWPAPSNSGIVVTDRAVLRLEKGGPLDAEIAPTALYGPLRRAWPEVRRLATDAAARSVDTLADSEVAAILRRSAELDATIIHLLGSASRAASRSRP